MSTLSDVIHESRYYIQDQREPYRQADDELERYLKQALGELYRYRPDIFPTNTNGACVSGVPTWCNLSETFPLAEQWSLGISYFIAASAFLKDDEHSPEGSTANYFFTLARRAMGVA